MKKISGWFTAILITAAVVAAFTVPSKEKLQQQLAAGYGDSAHVNIEETNIKIIAPLASICTYTITGNARTVNLKVAGGKPLAVATLLKQGVYVGLFGRFWQWK